MRSIASTPTSPTTWRSSSGTRRRRVEGRYFKSSEVRAFAGNHADVTLTMDTLAADASPAADLPALRDDISKLDRSAARRSSSIRDADVKKPAFLGLGKKDFAATLKERQEDTIAKVSADDRRRAG